MASTLPGMPLAAGDVFVCWIGDGAPRPRPRRPPSRPGPTGVWLVLQLCPGCGPRYCQSHHEANWWLTHWGR